MRTLAHCLFNDVLWAISGLSTSKWCFLNVDKTDQLCILLYVSPYASGEFFILFIAVVTFIVHTLLYLGSFYFYPHAGLVFKAEYLLLLFWGVLCS